MVRVSLNSNGSSLGNRSVDKAVNEPEVSGFLVRMSSDIEITTETIGTIIGSE